MQFQELLIKLSTHTAVLDRTHNWPGDQLGWLAEAGVLRWGLPEVYGGVSVTEQAQIQGYLQLAEACLSTTFVLTQRNGACQRIASSANDRLQQRLLPDLMAGKTFATVGISHLTTSRQHLGRPAVTALKTPQGYRLDGTIPWVTGAAEADYIVAGGTLDDGRQILMAIPQDSPGVTVGEPAGLMSLTSSKTGSVILSAVNVREEFLIAGPMEGVMNFAGKAGTGSLVTSALAIGLATRAISWIEQEATNRPDLKETAAAFQHELHELTAVILNAAADSGSPAGATRVTSSEIRQQANSLALRSSQAMLAVSKGAGFVQGHPAEQAVREAMFFLVWSCPQPVVAAALRELTCSEVL